MPRSLLSLAALLTTVSVAVAQGGGIRGDWRTPDGAVVHVASCGPAVCATLVQLGANTAERLDTNNPDAAQRSRKLCGLQIGYGFHLSDPNHADDGHLYDPKSGKTYKGTMSSDGDSLDLRGYVGMKAFGRSEHWTRTTAPQQTCS